MCHSCRGTSNFGTGGVFQPEAQRFVMALVLGPCGKLDVEDKKVDKFSCRRARVEASPTFSYSETAEKLMLDLAHRTSRAPRANDISC